MSFIIVLHSTWMLLFVCFYGLFLWNESRCVCRSDSYSIFYYFLGIFFIAFFLLLSFYGRTAIDLRGD